jgi:acetyl-CoA acetyltransferase
MTACCVTVWLTRFQVNTGWHTEDLVKKAGLSREEQDQRAARSQQRFVAAQKAAISRRKSPQLC